MIDRGRMAKSALKYGIELNAEQLERLEIYARLLVEWNEKMNLTAITEPEEVEVKHFLDSLLLTKHIGSGSVIDVGTGAGFPGMVMKIANPELNICLLDGLEKRLSFLDAVSREIGLKCRLIHARAEDAGHDAALRESFDAATARAVAPLNILSEYCLPFVREGGIFAAMKASAAEDEAAQAQNAITELGGKTGERHGYTLPDGSEREIIIINKVSSTPEKYPRRAPVIKKKPL